jgi:hypothetical protein
MRGYHHRGIKDFDEREAEGMMISQRPNSVRNRHAAKSGVDLVDAPLSSGVITLLQKQNN